MPGGGGGVDVVPYSLIDCKGSAAPRAWPGWFAAEGKASVRALRSDGGSG